MQRSFLTLPALLIAGCLDADSADFVSRL